MLDRIKRGVCYIIIILLLPYILTVFLNGSSITTYSHVDGTTIKVRPEKDADVIEIPIEDYCIGVMAKSISPTYQKETLKAQAVAVRSMTFREIEQSGTSKVFEEDYWDEKQMEDAWGMKSASYRYKLEKAWNDTAGQVVCYENAVALTPYFRLSNGSTRDGKEVLGSDEYPYLKMVECPLDIESKEELRTRTFDDLKAEVLENDSAGYVLSVKVGEEQVSGEEFRKAYDLDSSCFTLQDYDGKLRITTRGVGHGLGMSQYTADRMAKEGKAYKEILEYFFPGTEIKEVTEILKSTE